MSHIPFQLRRDTAANWTANNPILREGEIGYETDDLGTDSPLYKVGDGTTDWTTLPYVVGGSGDVVGPASSTDNHVALFDGTTGKLIKDGGALGTMAVEDAADYTPTAGLGTAAFTDATDYATAAQGTTADSALQPNAPITPATKTKITYDADGLVIAGADATTADIADSTDKRYVTDAELVVIGNTSGTNTGDQTNITGNAATATALQTARTIDGTSFNGTANITVVGPAIFGAANKATPADLDRLALTDSAASNVLKYVTWGQIQVVLNSVLSAIFAPLKSLVTAVTSSAGVITLNYALGEFFTITLTENITGWTFSGLPGAGRGTTIALRITQHASSPKTVAWPASFKWAGGVAGVVSATNGAVDMLVITTFDNGTTWLASLNNGYA